MKKITFLFLSSILFCSCEMTIKNGNLDDEKSEDTISKREESKVLTLEERTKALEEKGYQVFHYKAEDSTYLMQQYFMVFLKKGENRNQDSTETAELQKQHLAHLTRMANEGYTSLTGPFGDDGDIRGIVVYNTPNIEMADSLAKLDPIVKAGRLEVEVHPWWVGKGGKLQ
ncbi:YciI family protein [Mesonia sp. K7]|uniref:YciI family protein n=1 Tax=Mesonia sp. K7 TaxID=2218606 RepID=UPI001F3A0D15|nr:YciI family protein [Mesonia sp. K7]